MKGSPLVGGVDVNPGLGVGAQTKGLWKEGVIEMGMDENVWMRPSVSMAGRSRHRNNWCKRRQTQNCEQISGYRSETAKIVALNVSTERTFFSVATSSPSGRCLEAAMQVSAAESVSAVADCSHSNVSRGELG